VEDHTQEKNPKNTREDSPKGIYNYYIVARTIIEDSGTIQLSRQQ